MKQVTLLFLRKDDQILLAMKKRGFGVDKWNGVGGKADNGETIEQTAVRECQEEISVTPTSFKKAGELHFFDLPDVEHYCHIFVATEWEGEPQETEEMRPEWFSVDEIPYSFMWPDDIYWLPKLVAGVPFKGKVVVEDDTVKECDIFEVDSI